MKRLRRRLLLGLLVVGGVLAYCCWESRLAWRQSGAITAAAERYGVERELVKAVVWRESRFHPQARGRAGEIGLMQLQETAAREWAAAERLEAFEHEQCLDPVTNTMAGTFYLKKLLRRYAKTDDPVPYALADYNAGRANVRRWDSGEAATNSALFIEQIGFPGTKSYVKAVMRRCAFYRLLARVGWK